MVSSMLRRLVKHLKQINPWHFIWIIMIFAEVFTAIMNSVQSYIFWGRIDRDLMIIGTIDAFFITAVIAPVAIYFLRHSDELERNNEELSAAIIARDVSEHKTLLLRNALELLPIGITVSGEDGKIIYVNRSEAANHGYEVDELHGKSARELAPHRLWKERSVAEVDDKGIWRRETANMRKDGSEFPVQLISLMVRDEKGIPRGFVTACEDITERTRMQDIILQSKLDWEDTFDTINDVITIHDMDFNIIRANKAAENMLGLSFMQISGQKCFQSYHGTDCPKAGCPSCQTLVTGEPSQMEIYEPHLGRYLEIKALPRFGKDNELVGLVHVVRDISKHKEAEDRVRKMSRMTHEILERSPYGVYVVNSLGMIEYVNQVMLTISGTAKESFVGVNVFELSSYKDIGLSVMIHSALEGDSFSFGPLEYTSHYGKKTSTRIFTGLPFEDRGEKKALVFVEDISKRAEAERQQKKLESELLQVQKMDSIGRLAGGVAHDFNNILSAIIGYSELALLKIPKDSPAYESVKIVKDSGERAAALTHQLLAFSRKQVLRMEAVNLNAVIDNITKMLIRIIGEDITLELHARSRIDSIMADSRQIEQVLLNLAVNARDAMPLGGSLVIETSDVEIDQEYAEAHEDANPGLYVMLSVSDTGSGMPKEVQDRIFEPFFTTKEVGKGTGLGLATVYGIVKQHNGFIYVYSEEGKGTTFKVYLPVDREMPQISLVADEEKMLRGTETILVVDDDNLVRRLIVDTLQPLGYTVIEASSGQEAVLQIDHFPGSINLLLTDVIMPEMNGRQVAEVFAAKRPGVQVVYMSGYTDDAISHHGVLDKGVVLIEKPLTPSKLASMLRSVLDGRQCAD